MKKQTLFILISLLVLAVATISIMYLYNWSVSKKLQQNKDINIVFTADMKYIKYTKVAIKSAIMNKKSDSKYHINILCVDVPEKQIKEFNSFNTKNVEITTVPVKLADIKTIGNYELGSYVSRADLFKFKMPELFPNLDKILYIDSDVVIQKDLSELYNTNINNRYLAAVKRFDGIEYNHVFSQLYWARYQYNCGVLLMNLEKWRKGHITEKLIEEKNNDYWRRYMTQNIFNKVIPSNTIKQLSPLYNANARVTPEVLNFIQVTKHYAHQTPNHNSVEEFFKDAVIIHYSGAIKPWNDKELNQAPVWWKYAKMVDANWQVEPFEE